MLGATPDGLKGKDTNNHKAGYSDEKQYIKLYLTEHVTPHKCNERRERERESKSVLK